MSGEQDSSATGKNDAPYNVSQQISALKHDKKNQQMKSLPSNYTVQRRPLYHAPVASPYAGANVQKVVYVSNNTPIMSAVKRVKRLLSQIERRAIQRVDTKTGESPFTKMTRLTEINDHIAKTDEQVLVKASGRAMSQALRVGEWFRTKEKEWLCKVDVRTGSVQAIDDIVETQETQMDDGEEEGVVPGQGDESASTTVLEGGETTMELLGSAVEQPRAQDRAGDAGETSGDARKTSTEPIATRKKRKRHRRKRAVYDPDDLPEARLRWVKTVEVAISLKA